jgi:hypothetical protein
MYEETGVATGSQETAELVGALVKGATAVNALNAAKILRTGSRGRDLGLWPSPGSGRRIAFFEPEHLTNLLLALACGKAARAVETVKRYREIPRAGDPRAIVVESREVRPAANALVDPRLYPTATTFVEAPKPELLTQMPSYFPNTLGLLFDNLILAWVGSPEPSEDVRVWMREQHIVVALGPSPWAEFVMRGGPGTEGVEVRDRYAVAATAELHASTTEPLVFFRGALFERLAAILVGTWAEGAYPVLTTGGQPVSVDETAAALAGAAAAAGDPPATADGCPGQAHPTGERDKPQPPPSVSRIGHLPQNDWGVVTDDEGRNGAALAAAAQARRDAGRSQADANLS